MRLLRQDETSYSIGQDPRALCHRRPDYYVCRKARAMRRIGTASMSGVAGRAGPTWERTVADYAASPRFGLLWDRAPLRGTRDLLDLQGCLPAGFLVGCKAIRRGSTFGAKISEAMDQCDRALVNIGRPAAKDGNGRLLVDCGGIVPVQVMQRSGYPPGKAYVVTQLDYFLDLAVRRQKWRDDE